MLNLIGKLSYSHIGSESKENLSKFGQKMSKNTFEFWHFLSETAEAVWGQKSFKWLIRHKFSLLRTTPSSINRPIIQNQSHTIMSKHHALSQKPCSHFVVHHEFAKGKVATFSSCLKNLIQTFVMSNLWN